MGVAQLLLGGQETTAAYSAAIDAATEADITAVLALVDHPDPEVRRTVTWTLPLLTHGDPPTAEMVEAAITLTVDTDKVVRDYACFALAQQWRDIDSPRIRDALAVRLEDLDRDTRSEALLGLANRRDPRALPRVREALSRPSGNLWRLELLAAGSLSDPQLHDLVLRHQDGWPQDKDIDVADLVRRLTDPDGPGQDVINGVAQLYIARAAGDTDDHDLGAWQTMADMLDIAPHRAQELFELVLERLDDHPDARQQLQERSLLAQLAADQATDC